MFSNAEVSGRFFHRVTAHPIATLCLSIIAIVLAASGLTTLVKDTSVKAFIPADHPALLADEKAAEIFGLSDTLAIAIEVTNGGGVFEPATLNVVAGLTDQVMALANVRADRVTSLATESSISGNADAIDVIPYIQQPVATMQEAGESRARWRAMPPHIGTIVSADESSAIILAELVDSEQAEQTYHAVLELAVEATVPGLNLHVAGPGAVSGYLSSYIDRDAGKLQPLVFIVVIGFIYLAFRRLRALPGPLLVVAGAAGGSIGIMAWNGVPYYAITNALPVIVVAISVADAIHILSAYFQFRAQLPDAPVRDHTVHAMVNMARPITLTTMTTIAGFVGIGAASIMPPITAFAWYAALGVALAWVFSIFALPNMLILLRLGPSPAFTNWVDNKPSGLGKFLARIGSFSAAHYSLVLVLFVAASLVAINGATKLRIDRAQVDNFASDEPIRIADETINRTFSGTAFLDVIIESNEPEGLLETESMQRIAELQEFFESLPHVQKTIGIADYLSLLHQAIEGRAPDAGSRQLPEAEDGIAQHLLVYEMAGDPTDFEEEIDYEYQTALVRGILNTPYFSESRATVEALQAYVDNHFNDPTITATLAGDVTVGYYWMSQLEKSHFVGVGLSLALVLLTSMLIFRSLTAGLIAVVPVTFTVLVLYAVMGYLGIYLEPATSMFAAIALGVGVDFGIHLVERLRHVHAGSTAEAVDRVLPPTARACFFNSAALGLGFSVLLVSNLPTLQRFGGLVAVSAISSYVAALVIVPALFAAENALRGRIAPLSRKLVSPSIVAVVLLVGFLLFTDRAIADVYGAQDIAQSVADRPEGQATRRTVEIALTNRRGRSKARRAEIIKENRSDARYSRITYSEPKSIRGTAFLSHDFRDPSSSNNGWLYMPALRKARRVPASDRGDYFLGTDFTYEDIQSELKFDLADYLFEYEGTSQANGVTRHHLAGRPASSTIGKQLGYGAFRAIIDESNWMPIEVEFFDLRKEPLKTIYVSTVEKISGIWTATDIRAVNHQTGHQTHFMIRDVSYPADLDDQLFEPAALTRGLSSIPAGEKQ